jgi:hypothetical protein
MVSRWYELKSEAIKMRENGISIREVEKRLKIPRSTLSGWFKNIKLTEDQKIKLDKNWRNALNQARGKAILWHNKQKEMRIIEAQNEALETLSKIDINDKYILELALAMLYLGEGAKTQTTSMANSNPLIVKFFIKSLEKVFRVDKNSLKFELHLRSNQNEIEAIKYWSKELGVNKNAISFIKDKRVAKTATYTNYKGVCVAICGRIAIQRRIVHLAEEFSRIAIVR